MCVYIYIYYNNNIQYNELTDRSPLVSRTFGTVLRGPKGVPRKGV